MRLSDLTTGSTAVIVKTLGHGAFRKRLMEMGFVKGHEIKVILAAPLRDPVKYEIMGYEVSLRHSEAEMVEVEPISITTESDDTPGSMVSNLRGMGGIPLNPSGNKVINVALIGNPNCGKTSLFNIASGASEHVGNYSGVTVDAKKGRFYHKGYTFNIVDLPGTYSLASYSPEEQYVRRFLHDETPDVIINVVDGSNLERNLYLTTELIDMDHSMVIALNMADEMESMGLKLDYATLGEMIGVPIVPTAAKTGKGIDKLFDTVIRVVEDKEGSVRHVHVNLGPDIEPLLTEVKDALKSHPTVGKHFSPRYLAIKLLEGDPEIVSEVKALPDGESIIEMSKQSLQKYEKGHPSSDLASAIADEKYGFIAGALAETLDKAGVESRITSTRIIDAIVTNKLFGFPIFIAIMVFTFWATFEVGSYPMEWIESFVSWLGGVTRTHMPDGWVKDLISDGIIGGVGGVIVFLPNILILYTCISFMEDSGYMARAAFIMDKVMHRLGLHGKSFIPLVMGFGCTVPSIMASRSIESRSSRIITILINPFISCSARIPIYVLLIGTFFPMHATLMFIGIYVLGILAASLTARLLRRFWFGPDETPFVMELPPYRVPTAKSIWRHTWAKGEQYLRKMGGIILVASIVVWALNYFPHHDDGDDVQTEMTAVADDSAIDLNRDSYLQMIGKAVNPVMEPLGFHWRGSVAAIAGVPAKEIVVSTLGVLYTGDEEASEQTLSARLREPNPATGRPDFTAASALAFMVFILLYCPCIATVTAVVRETGSPRYGLFTILYNTALAWVVALGVYRIALLVL
ncbi:MAG: ferrous iron transport protein B [Muribaculaceae bacterium]|nr:ferrous iron transport protein B [Muribaculaceae bacterium]